MSEPTQDGWICSDQQLRVCVPAHYLRRLRSLLQDAQAQGIVLSIDQQPLEPLAMGHFECVAGARWARGREPQE